MTRRLAVDDAVLNYLRSLAEDAADPVAMRRVADLFERVGRVEGARALRRKAQKYEEKAHAASGAR